MRCCLYPHFRFVYIPAYVHVSHYAHLRVLSVVIPAGAISRKDIRLPDKRLNIEGIALGWLTLPTAGLASFFGQGGLNRGLNPPVQNKFLTP